MSNDANFSKIKPDSETKKFYTVRFNVCRNENTTNPIDVLAGMPIPEKPTKPTKPGCKFDGWYADREHKKPYDFDSPVNADITLYAKWVASEAIYYLTFNGYSDYTVVPVAFGHEAPKMKEPIREGYNFIGWFLADVPAEEYLYLFDTPVTEDLTLWAMWDKAIHR